MWKLTLVKRYSWSYHSSFYIVCAVSYEGESLCKIKKMNIYLYLDHSHKVLMKYCSCGISRQLNSIL